MIRWIPNPDQVNLHRANPIWLMSYAKWYKAQLLLLSQIVVWYAQRNITKRGLYLLKASITTDSIKIFSMTFCTQVIVYCTCKLIAKDAFRVELYVTTSALHAALCYSLFPFNRSNLSIVEMYSVQGCMLLKGSVFVLWINNFKCNLKMNVSLVLATEHIKL